MRPQLGRCCPGTIPTSLTGPGKTFRHENEHKQKSAIIDQLKFKSLLTQKSFSSTAGGTRTSRGTSAFVVPERPFEYE